jgi:hypothetical protein
MNLEAANRKLDWTWDPSVLIILLPQDKMGCDVYTRTNSAVH